MQNISQKVKNVTATSFDKSFLKILPDQIYRGFQEPPGAQGGPVAPWNPPQIRP